MQLSLLFGKQLLTKDGARLGYVTGVRLDKTMSRLLCLSAADDDEEEFFLPARAVLAFGDAVIVNDRRTEKASGAPSPIGLSAFSEQGEDLGTVADLFFGDGEASFLLQKDGKTTQVPASFVKTGETAIVYSAPVPKKTSTKRRKKAPAPALAPTPTEREEGFRCNLLGRKVKVSVFDGEGNAIALAGERITPQTLALARRKNRLLALTVHTLTNLV